MNFLFLSSFPRTLMFGYWLGAYMVIGISKIILFTPVEMPKHVPNDDEFSIVHNSVFLKLLRCQPFEFLKKKDSEEAKVKKGRVTTIAFAYEVTGVTNYSFRK